MILIIDNYDSFTYNLYQYLGTIEPDIKVVRNDELTVEDIKAMAPDHIVLSPGPGRPEDAGICVDVVKQLSGTIPILGICLGHQAIALALGAEVDYAPEILHGKVSLVKNTKQSILKNSPETFEAGRYHSLCVPEGSLPVYLESIAETEDGIVMAIAHKTHSTFGLQFHPESILTSEGMAILKCFLEIKSDSMKALLEQLVAGEDLTENQAYRMMSHIMSGDFTPVQISGLLVALKIKGETVDEITGCAKAMREKASEVSLEGEELLDTCGTGGDGGKTFNVSTAAGIVAAAAGVKVAKHGNRSVSSKCGSADILEALGVEVGLPPEGVKASIQATGIGFMFAPVFHQAMKYAITPRKELGIRTIFNVLGPLTNPAKASFQIVGVYDESLLEPFANVLKRMGIKRALIVYGEDKLDEISLCEKTKVCELKANGSIERYAITPEDVGLTRSTPQAVQGGDKEDNVKIITDILEGKRDAPRDLVCLNAGAALYVAGKAATIKEGVALAGQLIDSGRVKAKLEEWAAFKGK